MYIHRNVFWGIIRLEKSRAVLVSCEYFGGFFLVYLRMFSFGYGQANNYDAKQVVNGLLYEEYED